MRKVSLIAAMAACASFALAQNFTNGNFETGNFTGWTITPTANGQSTVQTVELFDIDGGGPLGTTNAAKFSVGQVVFTSGVPAGIEITQALGLTAGVQYTFHFDLAAVRTTTAGNAQGGIFDLIVNGTSLANFAAGSTSSTTPHYSSLTANFTPVTSGSYVVGARIQRPFTIPGAGGSETLFQYVDNFTASGVPEPASMVALGLGAACLLRRRKKS